MASIVKPITTEQAKADLTLAYWVLLAGVIAAAFASVLMKLSQAEGIPSLMVATGRLAIASLCLTPIVIRRYGASLRTLNRVDVLWAMVSGVWIAIHFIFLVFALENTSIMVLQVIINTGPLWVALLEVSFLKVRMPRMVWVGLFMALFGSSVIAAGGFFSGDNAVNNSNMALGTLLALLGSMAGSIYLAIGRKARRGIPAVPYVWIVFSVGAIVGLGAMAFSGTSLVGHDPKGYFWLLVLGLGPQLIGHSSFNYAVGYIQATLVSLTSQAIVIPSAIIAFFVFREIPGPFEFVGSLIIAIGALIAILNRQRQQS